MIHERIQLQDFYPFLCDGSLQILCLESPYGIGRKWARPMVIVVPGGAYYGVSKKEGEPIAAEFLAKGYHVCILKYLCKEDGAHYPEQITELACAIDYICKNSERLSVNSEEIFAVGFSAGGHLVADYSNEYFDISNRIGVCLLGNLKAVGLAYPVIDDHKQSFDNLLFDCDPQEKDHLRERLKAQYLVGKHTPPTFLWTTADDEQVPAQNSLRYALALADHKIPFEFHVYPKGKHGMSNGSAEINEADPSTLSVLSDWTRNIIRFFRSFCTEAF